MQKPKYLDDWFSDAVDGDVVVDPAQINREANENLRYFAIGRGKSAPDLEALVSFVAKVVEARSEHLRERRSRSMTMYWWHDELAGQLRYSLVCSSHRRLPFAAPVKRLDTVRPILEDWLASPWLRGIPFSAFTSESRPASASSRRRYVVPVWSVVLRGR